MVMELILLSVVTFFAATVQAATGFGFGLIAVSALLIALNSVAAIQVVIIVTLLMSCLHWPKLKKFVPGNTMKWLVSGCVFGFPLGIYLLSILDLEVLKAVIAILIIMISLQNIWMLLNTKSRTEGKGRGQTPGAMVGVGFASGVMASSMAMPGPAVMLYLSRTALQKNEIRATILSFFVFSYAGALAMQFMWVGIELQTWTTAAVLSPAAIFGVIAGEMISQRINQQFFKAIVLAILLVTGGFMLANL
jgi:uncharacterized membrane protein YfcA